MAMPFLKKDCQRGAALLTVMVFAIILAFSGFAFFKMGDMEGVRFHTDKRYAQALYAAEAAIDKLSWIIKKALEINATEGNPCDPCQTNPFDGNWYSDNPENASNVTDIITLLNPEFGEHFYPEENNTLPYFRILDVRGEWSKVRFLVHGAVDLDRDGIEGLEDVITLRVNAPTYLQVGTVMDGDDVNRYFEGYIGLPGSLGEGISAGAKDFYDGEVVVPLNEDESGFKTSKGDSLPVFRFHEKYPGQWSRWGYILGKPVLREETGLDDLTGEVALPPGLFDSEGNLIEDYFSDIPMKRFHGNQTFSRTNDPTGDIPLTQKAVLYVDGDVTVNRPDFAYISTTGQHYWSHTDVVIIATGKITVKNPDCGFTGRMTLIAKDIYIDGEWGNEINGLAIASNNIYLRYRSSTLPFDAGTSEFHVDKENPTTLTGSTSGASGTILGFSVASGSWDDNDAAGTITLSNIVGTFVDNETITDNRGGSATANIYRNWIYTYSTMGPTYWSAYFYGTLLAGNNIQLNEGVWAVIYDKNVVNGSMFDINALSYEKGEADTNCWSNFDPDGGSPEMIFKQGLYLTDESNNNAGDSKGTGDPPPQNVLRIASQPDIEENGDQEVGVGESIRFNLEDCGKDGLANFDDWSKYGDIRFYMALDNYRKKTTFAGGVEKETWKEAKSNFGLRDAATPSNQVEFNLTENKYLESVWGKKPYYYPPGSEYEDDDIDDEDPVNDNYSNPDPLLETLPKWVPINLHFSEIVDPTTPYFDFSKVSEFYLKFTDMRMGYIKSEPGQPDINKEIRYDSGDNGRYFYYEKIGGGSLNGPYRIRAKGSAKRLQFCNKLDWNCTEGNWQDIKWGWDKDGDGDDDNLYEDDLRTTLRLDRIEVPGGQTMNYGFPSCFRYEVSKWREFTEEEVGE